MKQRAIIICFDDNVSNNECEETLLKCIDELHKVIPVNQLTTVNDFGEDLAKEESIHIDDQYEDTSPDV